MWVNCYFAMDADCPFGGRKMSGFGKDDGMHALDKFLAVKSVARADDKDISDVIEMGLLWRATMAPKAEEKACW